MKKIYNYLERAHRLQTSCFNTPISVNVSTCKTAADVGHGESYTVVVTIMVENGSKTYLMSSDMPDDVLTQKWGTLKRDVDDLLDKLVGKRINAHGREKKPKQQ